MKRFLIGLVLVVAVIVGLGFYQGWFRLTAGGTEGQSNIPVSIDTKKFEQDKEQAKEKVQELTEKVRDKTNTGTDGSKEEASRP